VRIGNRDLGANRQSGLGLLAVLFSIITPGRAVCTTANAGKSTTL